MSDFQIPIDSSDLGKVIPSGQDILYSTLCRGTARRLLMGYGKGVKVKERTYTWITHVLVTSEGIAVSIPLEVSHAKRKLKDLKPQLNHYFTWEHAGLIDPNIPQKEKDRLGITGHLYTPEINGISDEPCDFTLIKDGDSESEDNYNKRVTEFYEKFFTLSRQKASNHRDNIYENLKNNPKMTHFDYEKKYGPVSFAIFWFVQDEIKKKEKIRIQQQKAEEKQKKKLEKQKKKK